MKKIIFSGITFMSFFMVSCCFGADETVTTAGKPLTVEEFTDAKDAYLEPTVFPDFYEDSSEDNPDCGKNISGKDRWTPTKVAAGAKWAQDRFPYRCSPGPGHQCDKSSVKLSNGDYNYSNCSQAMRNCTSSGDCVNIYFPCKETGYDSDGVPNGSNVELLKEDKYQRIPGLKGTIKPAKGYRSITKILFTWTVRLEGYKRLLAVWPFLCHPHHGTSYQEFPEGQLKTRLYVKSEVGNKLKNDDGSYADGYIPVGQIAEMTVPSAGKDKIGNIGDPTITGSYVLLPSDFSNERIPLKVDFEVRWYNETSMRIRSPANQRNLVVTVFPITDQRSEEL